MSTEFVTQNSIMGRLERAELQLADLDIPFERPSKSPEVNLVHAERLLASPKSYSPGVYSPPKAKPSIFARAQRNIEAIIAGRVDAHLSGGPGQHSVPPIQQSSQPHQPAQTDARHRAISEDDPIARAALHARADEAAGVVLTLLTIPEREALRAAANAESEPLKRALLHQRAAR